MAYVDNQETRDSLILQRNAAHVALAKANDEIARLRAELEQARAAEIVCYVCEKPMRRDQAVTDQDIDNICPECASETIGTLNFAKHTLYAGAVAADEYYRALLARSRETIRRLVVAARAIRQAARAWRDESVEWAFMLDDIRFRIANAPKGGE